jgi:hypothetical protein
LSVQALSGHGPNPNAGQQCQRHGEQIFHDFSSCG